MSDLIVEAAQALEPTAATKRFHEVSDVASKVTLIGYAIVLASDTETALFASVDESDMPYEDLEEAVAQARTLLGELRSMSTEPVQAHIVEVRHLTLVSA